MSAPPHPRRPSPEVLVAIAASILWLALAWNGAARLSPVIDEAPHLAAGLSVVRYHDLRMNPEHPMLFKVLATLPLLILDDPEVQLERGDKRLGYWLDGDQWRMGHYLIEQCVTDPMRALLHARIVPMLTGLAGGWLAFAWGCVLGGRRAGVYAMLFLLFYPEYLGHARYVTLDVPTLVSCAAVSLLGWHVWKRPSVGRAVAWCAAAAVLSLVKLPVAIFAVLLWCAGLVATIVAKKPHATRMFGVLALLALLGFVAQWANAGFRYGLVNPDLPPLIAPNIYATPEGAPSGVVRNVTAFAAEHRLLPEATQAILNHTTAFQGRIQFLFRSLELHGWRHYFLATILLKTPIAMLVGLVVALAWSWRLWRRRAMSRGQLFILVAPFLALFVLTCLSRVSIGHRHVLFFYFPWAVLMGGAAAALPAAKRWAKLLPAALAIWLVALCAWKHPWQATYFNAFGGGSPYVARPFLADSNIDWGEGLSLSAKALERVHGSRNCNLAAFGIGTPRAWGVGEYRFILPSYPFSVFVSPIGEPDPALPTVVSLNCLDAVRLAYPGIYERKPEYIEGPFVIFAPLAEFGGK